MGSGKLFIISAPSGAGKTSLVGMVLERVRPHYSIDRVITYTTKAARPGEQSGHDYHFLSPGEFERRIKQGFFLEWSTAYDAYYGSPRSILADIKKGQSYLLILDRAGAQQVVANKVDPVLIWVYTANMAVLRERLAARKTDNPEQIERRLERAKKEVDFEQRKRLYHHHILNDNFDDAVQQLEHIICNEFARTR